MKSIIKSGLLVILFCTQNFINAQAPEFKASRFFSNTETGTTFNQYLGSFESTHYFLKSSISGTETHYFLHSIYSDLTNGNTIRFRMPESLSTNKWDTDRNAIYNKTLRVFGTYRLKKESLTYYAAYELNASGELVNEQKLMSMTMDGLMNSGEFFSAQSADKSKYVVLFFHPEVKDQQTHKITLNCFNNSDLSLLWTKEFSLEIPSHKYPRIQLSADNDGNVGFLCTYKNEKDDYYKFYTYHAATDKLTELATDLSINDNITGERIYSYKPGEFVFSGMYVDKNALPNKLLQGLMMNGHFYYKTAETSAWGVKTKELYDSAFYENIFKNQVKADEIPYLGGCPLRYRFTRTDGREIWILENMHMTKVSEMAPGSTTVTYTYTNYSNALIIFCINQETGEIEWVNRLEKNQKEISKDNVIHHIHAIPYLQNDTLFVLWNNTELNDTELKGTWKEADGQSYEKVNTFGPHALYAPFMRAYDLNGKDIYSEFKYGLPLSGIFKNQDLYDLALNSVTFANRDENALYVIAQFNKGFKYQFIEIRF